MDSIRRFKIKIKEPMLLSIVKITSIRLHADHRVSNTCTNNLLSILHLKVIILPQFDISGLREFQSLTVHGKKLYLNMSVFY